ncbi:ATP synthase subunit delta, mitochondrial-like, partial [Ruditapes philippinarum]|uniref:ATP synthase subunit delta, mitochondrial-like n=2 Tax=Ruditapes philippinarum TaxID=129788 RepID=UPI00295B0C39
EKCFPQLLKVFSFRIILSTNWDGFYKSDFPCQCPSSIFVANMSLCRQLVRGPRLLAQCQRLAVLNQQRCNESTDADKMKLTFASPGRVYYNGDVVQQVDLSTLGGSVGILARHVPMIAALKPGVVTVFQDNDSQKVFVSSGTVTVNNDSTVQILAEEAYPLDSFDSKAVASSISNANTALSSAKNDEEKAEAQIALDCLEEISKAMA